jgi:hypothetical protein
MVQVFYVYTDTLFNVDHGWLNIKFIDPKDCEGIYSTEQISDLTSILVIVINRLVMANFDVAKAMFSQVDTNSDGRYERTILTNIQW